MANRISVAIEFMKEGKSFFTENLRFGIDDNGCVEIVGWSLFNLLHNVTKESSLDELEQIKEQFYILVDNNQDLEEFIRNKCILFKLSFDDLGKASIDICEEFNGGVKWIIDDLPDK